MRDSTRLYITRDNEDEVIIIMMVVAIYMSLVLSAYIKLGQMWEPKVPSYVQPQTSLYQYGFKGTFID